MSREGREPTFSDALTLLKLAKQIPAGSFPALKDSAGSTLCIIDEVAV